MFGSMGGGNEIYTGDIGHSLRFRGAQYLTRTPGSASNRTTWTMSMWVKRAAIASNLGLFHQGVDVNNHTAAWFTSDGMLNIHHDDAGSGTWGLTTTPVYRDPSAWYHIVFAVDTTQGTASDRVKVYVNGVQVTAFSVATYPTASFATDVNTTDAWRIGDNTGRSYFYEGNMSRIAFVDGSALTPSSFGYLNTEINEWVSKSQSAVKAVVDAGGTNSFMLDFDDATSLTTLGYDKSSKGNNWTPNNFSLTAGTTYDHMLDVPGNSFATLNPLCSSATLSNANLYHYNSGGSNAVAVPTVAFPPNQKTYVEVLVTSGWSMQLGMTSYNTPSPSASIGIITSDTTLLYYSANGVCSTGATNRFTGSTYGVNDVLGFAVDTTVSPPTLQYYLNNVPQGTPVSALTNGGVAHYLMLNCWGGAAVVPLFGQAPLHASATYDSASGGYFRYAPPTGFKALCQRNMPDPAILNPELHFDVVTRTGDGTDNKQITGTLFTPDFLWDKPRNAVDNHRLFNSVAGIGGFLVSNATTAETADATCITSFNSNGFTMGTDTSNRVNVNAQTYVDWLWKAGGAAVTNNAGSISSQVSANVDAGFSIVTYTGNGVTAATVGHGLGVVPKMVITKERGTGGTNWMVRHESLSAVTDNLFLQGTNPATNISSAVAGGGLNNLSSSTVFGFRQGTTNVDNCNRNSGTFVAYCFAEIPGYSKIFSYTGNGSADGPYVDCGFKPKYVLIKRTDSTGSWWIYDNQRSPYNMATQILGANISDAEYSTGTLDGLGAGFKPRGTDSQWNASGATYIGIAFADVSGKYALGR